jgi:hypothetical protein
VAGRTVALNESASAVLNGAGGATIQMRPDGPHERWMPTGASAKVQTAGAVNPPEAVCRVYVGAAPTDDNFVDSTASGSFGDSTDRVTGHVIARTAEPYIWGVWTGGEPGATATLTVTGTKVVYS